MVHPEAAVEVGKVTIEKPLHGGGRIFFTGRQIFFADEFEILFVKTEDAVESPVADIKFFAADGCAHGKKSTPGTCSPAHFKCLGEKGQGNVSGIIAVAHGAIVDKVIQRIK